MNSIPVVLDVDTGIDDALAIILAVRHPSLDVRAITCVGGNVALDQVVANTLSVLSLAGAEAIPVAAGMQHPLIEPPQDASYVHGRNGLADIVFPPHSLKAENEHAVEVLRRTLDEAPDPVTIIALAPLTNVAVLLRMYPQVIPKINRIVFMGGATGTGNATATAEFNVWHDPEATEIVLRSGIPTTMYSLEPFYRVTCDAQTISELQKSTVPLRSTVGALLGHLAAVTADESRVETPGAAAIGDAGTVCAVIDPGGILTKRVPVSVALSGPHTRGQTIVDLRSGLGAGGEVTSFERGNVDVVVDIDEARYREMFLAALT